MPGLEELINQIKTGNVKYIVGIEKDGARHFIKSDHAARAIGFFYRASLKEEKPENLTSKLLPFPNFWKQESLKGNIPEKLPSNRLLFPDCQEGNKVIT